MKLVIEKLQLSDIKLPKRLLKEHPARQIEQIAHSIEEFGFNDPVAIDEAGEIIEGAGRVLAARQLSLETIPVIRLRHLSEAQKHAYRIAHNKICLNTGFDLDTLKEAFENLCQLDEKLVCLTGFEKIELDDLLLPKQLPALGPEISETLKEAKSITCPNCGGTVYV
jgi:hypothetical protein